MIRQFVIQTEFVYVNILHLGMFTVTRDYKYNVGILHIVV